MRRIRAVVLAVLAAGVVSAEDAYLQSDGTQVIDTGYFINGKTQIEVDFAFTETGGNGWTVFGQQQTSGAEGNYLRLYSNLDSKLTVGFSNASYVWATVWADVSAEAVRRTFIYDSVANQATLITGTVTNKDHTTLSGAKRATATVPMAIFGRANPNNARGFDNLAKMKLYSFKIYERGLLVRDYRPAIDALDGKAKLMDFANGHTAFLDDALGGAFVGGGDIPTVREDPYLESDGTQAIDTGYKANAKTRIELDYQFMASTGSQMVFGQQQEPDKVGNYLGFYINSEGDTPTLIHGTSDYRWHTCASTVRSSAGRHTYIYDSAESKGYYITGTVTNDVVDTATCVYPAAHNTAQITMSIFARKNNYNCTNGRGYDKFAKARVYSLKIYENGVCVREYRPVVDTDGKGKLMDIAQNRNVVFDQADDQGNPFTFNVATPRLCEEAYLESNGTQIIDLGYRTKNTSRFEVDYEFTSFKGQDRVFGASGGGQDAEVYVTGQDNNSGNLAFGHGDTRYNNNWAALNIYVPADKKRRTMILDLYNDKYWYPYGNGSTTQEGAKDIADEAITMTVFGKHRYKAGEGLDYRQASKIKLYAFRVYEEGELAHQYFPYKNGDVAGLYDTVTGEVKTDALRSATPFVYHAGGYNNYEGAVPEEFAVAPNAKYSVSAGRAAVISVLAPGAYRYVWKKDGAELACRNATLEVAADEVHGNVTYRVQAFYLVDGVEVAGPAAETAVSRSGFVVIVR